MKQKILLLPGGWSRATDIFAQQIEFLKNSYDIVCPDINQFDTISAMSDFIINNYSPVYAMIGLSMGGFIA